MGSMRKSRLSKNKQVRLLRCRNQARTAASLMHHNTAACYFLRLREMIAHGTGE